jgi:hypothetical protein
VSTAGDSDGVAEANGSLISPVVLRPAPGEGISARLCFPHIGKVLQGAPVGKDVEETQELPVNSIQGRHDTRQKGVCGARPVGTGHERIGISCLRSTLLSSQHSALGRNQNHVSTRLNSCADKCKIRHLRCLGDYRTSQSGASSLPSGQREKVLHHTRSSSPSFQGSRML